MVRLPVAFAVPLIACALFANESGAKDLVPGVSQDGTGPWKLLRGGTFGHERFGDFFGDGRADVFQIWNGKWRVSNDAVGPWQVINSSNVPVYSLRFGDFNGDGKTDVFTSFGGKWQVSYGGTSNWTAINTSSYSVHSVRLGDFNGDGKTDVFSSSGGKWRVSFGGDSPWQVVNTSNVTIGALRLGDFNGDGRSDVLASWGGKWRVSLGATSPWLILNTSNVSVDDLVVGELDADPQKKSDILAAWNGAARVSYAGTQSWQPLNAPFPWPVQIVQLADFDGNGRDDVVIMFDCDIGEWAAQPKGKIWRKPPSNFYDKGEPCWREPVAGRPVSDPDPEDPGRDPDPGSGRCGGHNEFACERTGCDAGLEEYNGKCYGCGLLGQTCCQKGRNQPKTCVELNTVCDPFGNTCQTPG